MPLRASPDGFELTDADGRLLLNTERRNLRVVSYLGGTQALPRISTNASEIDQNYDLGAVDPASLFVAGQWRVSSSEGISPGSRVLISVGGFPGNTTYRYAPGINQNDWFNAAGLNFIDTYRFPWTGSAREVGDTYHCLQFYTSGGRVYLRRTGLGLSYFIAQYIAGGTVYGDWNNCAALTIEYRLWTGALT